MFLAHRINSLTGETAKQIFQEVDGLEFDVRSIDDRIIVTHDPFTEGQDFSEFITYLDPSKFYIVNVKCEGIEEECIRQMDQAGCKQFFLLDCSIPSIMRLGAKGERRMACRFSEVESIETVLMLSPYLAWVWIDVFTKLPLTRELAECMVKHDLRLCLVSPELQRQQDKVEVYRDFLIKEKIIVDAICGKGYNLHLWKPYFEFCTRSNSLFQPRNEATSESSNGIVNVE